MRKVFILFLLILYSITCFSQANGKIDNISDLSTVRTVPFTMPDGTKLMTDIYLPITSDSLVVPVDLGFGTVNIEIIPKGIQYLVYDSINGNTNFNKYQLPLIFTRTPYDKTSSGEEEIAWLFNLFGYAYAIQDNRGRYSSEGVYYPLYSDAWKKDVYHPGSTTNLDITSITDPHNSLYHEDGKNSIHFLTDSLKKEFDFDFDGTTDTVDFIYNGNIGMIGASATGYSQYQAASTIKIDPNKKGLKALMPIVATNEHFNTTLYNNGVFRQALVTNWMSDQLDVVTDTNSADTSLFNSLHSNFDYGSLSKEEITELSLDFVTSHKINGIPACNPNSFIRSDLDASHAPIDVNGNSSSTSNINRYTNMEVPIYHLTGWWDIFINGQIDTYNYCMDNLSSAYGNKQKQKLIIGPWSHTTVGEKKVADMTYKENVTDFTSFSLDNLNTDITGITDSEIFLWFRYNLNYNPDFYTGEPKFFIPESNKWQQLNSSVNLRIPSEDYFADYISFLNFLSGNEDLENLKIELDYSGTIIENNINLEADKSNAIVTGNSIPTGNTMYLDFASIPNVRFYVVGPIDDNIPENEFTGNYWFSSNGFPLDTGIKNTSYYLHQRGVIDTIVPDSDEGFKEYTHDPDNPVYSIGGNNFTFRTPSGVRSHAQMNLADPEHSDYTLNHPGVISFETEDITDSLSIIGVAQVKLYAETNPAGSPDSTDIDFFVRIVDVYPDGSQYYVFEGAVNARTREYARSLATGEENNAAQSNIFSGQVYEYYFNMLPIAYTFGKDHKMKVLISSSNYPKYQSNPCVPVKGNDFFRRTPNDGKTYTFNGTSYSPRIADQKIYFSPSFPSQIILPVYDGESANGSTSLKQIHTSLIKIYPNPTSGKISIVISDETLSEQSGNIEIFDIYGRQIYSSRIESLKTEIDLSMYKKGIYLVRVRTGNKVQTEKIIYTF